MFGAQRKCQPFCEAFFNPSGAFSDSVIVFIHLSLQHICSLSWQIRSSLKYRREWESIPVVFVSPLYYCSENSPLYLVAVPNMFCGVE